MFFSNRNFLVKIEITFAAKYSGVRITHQAIFFWEILRICWENMP